ncbi:MAG: CheR family methyltransferase, partial [Myxococcota bacterium]
RRIQRRMSLVGLEDLADYAQTLQQDEKELNALCVDLLIGVTRFFRDPDAWHQLTEQVLEPLIREDRDTRMWVAGCSTGQEAYTLAIAMHEAAVGLTVDPKVRIFATDANPRAIRIAMAGEFSADDLEGVPEELRNKYFEPHDDGYRVRRFLRDDITFAVHNLLTDPPFTRLDLVTCRNLLIYLKPDAQRPVLARLHFGLQNGGVLFLGPSETVGDQKASFQPIDLKWKLFRASGATRDLARMFGASGLTSFGRPPARRPATEVEFKPALDHYLPPGVAVDKAFDVMHVLGKITPFIELPEGRANLNLLNLLPPAVSVFLNSTARRVRGNQEHTVIPSVELNGRMVDLRVMPSNLASRGDDQGLMVFFEEIRSPGTVDGEASTFDLSSESAVRIEELKAELVLTRENLRTAVEDLEATNEELQATNEELIASNEELQSTNEELQSVNEELYTVNAEYQEKIEELEYLTGDLENLLRSIDVGALFLDSELRVRRFNDTVLRLLPLRAQDLGRSLSDLVLHADYPSFHEHVGEVLTSREPRTSRVVASDGTVWSVQIRPFDDTHRLTRGVIVMFHDQTAWDAQQTRIGKLAANELAAGLAGVGMVLVDVMNQTTQLSDVARSLLGLPDGEELGYDAMHELLAGDASTDGRDAENVLPTDTLRNHERPDGTTIVLRVFAQRVVRESSAEPHVLVALQKVRL